MKNKYFVSILMGSKSDLDVMQETKKILQQLQIDCEVRIYSAHRTPELVKDYIVEAEQRGCQLFIAGAGLAAHLAGAIAAHSIKPVIGVPLDAGGMGGMDSLLSTVQMPPGVPVATVAVGKPGAKNAAWLAAQILALNNDDLVEKLKQSRIDNKKQIINQNQSLINT